MMTELPPLNSALLPAGIRARFVENVNGLRMHVLEAGFESPAAVLLLLHGFPELAYSWRKVMGPLAAAGFHVIAPDQRGYGRTTGWDRLRRRPRLFRHAQPGARRSGWFQRSAIAPSRPWSATISAHPSRPGARSCGRTCFRRGR